MKKVVKALIILLVIAVAAIVGAKVIKAKRAKEAKAPVAKVYPIVAKTMVPKVGDVKLTLPYLAEVANDKDVVLSSRIAARILSIKKSSTPVKKGEVIAQLDTTNIKSDLKSIEHQIAAANIALKNLLATHQRTLKLLKIQGASIEQSQKETTKIAATKAQIAALKGKEMELKNNLSYAVITSPVDGVIAKSMGSVGGMSMPGKPLVQISSKNGFYLMVRVPTNVDIQGVRFNKKDFPAIALESTFHGLAEYKVYVDNAKLVSGDRVEVDVITYRGKGVLLPFDAVLNRDGKSYVLVVNGKRAKVQEVHIAQSAQQGVLVTDSFNGEKIVVAKPDILLKLTSGYALTPKE